MLTSVSTTTCSGSSNNVELLDKRPISKRSGNHKRLLPAVLPVVVRHNKTFLSVVVVVVCLMYIAFHQFTTVLRYDTSINYDSSEAKKIRRNVAPLGWSDVKLAIYMTTHLPDEHIAFLPCWNDAIQRLNIFEYADLIIFTSSDLTPEHLALLPFHSITIKNFTNPGYQEGAVRAMIEPFLDNVTWFDEYDWVIRLNPDVLIRDDTWLMKTMLNTSVDAIFHDCEPAKYSTKPILQSDFFAFRPDTINRNKLLTATRTYAETHLTAAFRHIYDSRRFAYVEGGYNSVEYECRIDGEQSPVLHVHELSKFCPNYYNATKKGIY